jgi:hypothetical protein
MSCNVYRLCFTGAITLLTVELLTPPALAQITYPMGFNSMHNGRFFGGMGMPWMGRGSFGMYPNMSAMMGLNRYSMSPYSMAPMGQMGGYMTAPGSSYGSQPSRLNASYQLPGSGDGYASATNSQDGKSTLKTTGSSQLKSLRQSVGGLSWPRALYYFTSDGKLKDLRVGIDTQVEALLALEDSKPGAADMVDGLKKDVESLQKRFLAQIFDLSMTSQQETDARQFLSRLKTALAQFPTAPASSVRQ